MADPISVVGLVASIATIVARGYEVYEELKAFSDAVRKADRKRVLDLICIDINGTAISLEQLSRNLEKEKTSHYCKPEFFSALKDTIDQCSLLFERIRRTVNPFLEESQRKDKSFEESRPAELGLLDKLRWPSKSKEIQDQRIELSQVKTDLVLKVTCLMHARDLHNNTKSMSELNEIKHLQREHISAVMLQQQHQRQNVQNIQRNREQLEEGSSAFSVPCKMKPIADGGSSKNLLEVHTPEAYKIIFTEGEDLTQWEKPKVVAHLKAPGTLFAEESSARDWMNMKYTYCVSEDKALTDHIPLMYPTILEKWILTREDRQINDKFDPYNLSPQQATWTYVSRCPASVAQDNLYQFLSKSSYTGMKLWHKWFELSESQRKQLDTLIACRGAAQTAFDADWNVIGLDISPLDAQSDSIESITVVLQAKIRSITRREELSLQKDVPEGSNDAGSMADTSPSEGLTFGLLPNPMLHSMNSFDSSRLNHWPLKYPAGTHSVNQQYKKETQEEGAELDKLIPGSRSAYRKLNTLGPFNSDGYDPTKMPVRAIAHCGANKQKDINSLHKDQTRPLIPRTTDLPLKTTNFSYPRALSHSAPPLAPCEYATELSRGRTALHSIDLEPALSIDEDVPVLKAGFTSSRAGYLPDSNIALKFITNSLEDYHAPASREHTKMQSRHYKKSNTKADTVARQDSTPLSEVPHAVIHCHFPAASPETCCIESSPQQAFGNKRGLTGSTHGIGENAVKRNKRENDAIKGMQAAKEQFDLTCKEYMIHDQKQDIDQLLEKWFLLENDDEASDLWWTGLVHGGD